MIKNDSVKDIKPSGLVEDVKSKNNIVLDVKSVNARPILEQETYYDAITAPQGSPMGLLLALTYPVDTSYQQART